MKHSKPLVIGLCGGSCSGKSTYSDILEKNLKSAVVITVDGYYKGGNEKTNFDHPESIDFPYMIEQLGRLIKGETKTIGRTK